MKEMPHWKTADEYTIDATGSFRKSVTLFARFGGSLWPVAYISRPKWISEDDFRDFISSVDMIVKVKS
jgi:hypothetical protein